MDSYATPQVWEVYFRSSIAYATAYTTVGITATTPADPDEIAAAWIDFASE